VKTYRVTEAGLFRLLRWASVTPWATLEQTAAEAVEQGWLLPEDAGAAEPTYVVRPGEPGGFPWRVWNTKRQTWAYQGASEERAYALAGYGNQHARNGVPDGQQDGGGARPGGTADA